MKHTNIKTEAKSARFIIYGAVAVLVAVMATACGKKDDSAAPIATVPGVGASCVGCSATMTGVIASANARSYNEEAELSLNFLGEAAQVNAGSIAGGYQGQFGANGVLRVRVARVPTGGVAGYGCSIPVGDYTITTTSPGMWDRQGFQRLQLLASGPVQLRLEIPAGLIQINTPALVDWAGATFPYRWVATRGVYVYPLSTGGYCNAGGYPEYQFAW